MSDTKTRPEDDDLTPSQREAHDKAYDILAEHFPAFVIVVDHSEDQVSEASHVSFFGGYHGALGLIDAGKWRLLNDQDPPECDEDDEDDGEGWKHD